MGKKKDKKKDKKKKPSMLPEPPKLPELPSLPTPETLPSSQERRLPVRPPLGSGEAPAKYSSPQSMSDSSDGTLFPERQLETTSGPGSPAILSEIKKKGFTEGLQKLEPSEIEKPAVKRVPTEIDYQSMLRKADPTELETPSETLRVLHLQFSEEYQRSAEDLEEKNMIPNAAVAYSCAAMCIYLAEDAKTAVNFLAGYAKGASTISTDPTFQAAKQVLKATILKNITLLREATQLLRSSMMFSREDKDVFEAAFRKAQKEIRR